MTHEDIFRALDFRITELEAELSLILEYFEKGVPYWHGISPVYRLRAVLKGKVVKDIDNMLHVRVWVDWRRWLVGVSWGWYWPNVWPERRERCIDIHLLPITIFISF